MVKPSAISDSSSVAGRAPIDLIRNEADGVKLPSVGRTPRPAENVRVGASTTAPPLPSLAR
jgi:hypothetical protein